ncbi:hypothetical protein ACFODL_15595 [Phenylobacterium terrae]|uniref:Uncharacterized protein n=1 Tax=Phenylobacterium terrae TaxID=2665495 RepID=A0ABW4N6S7_9CAUL
MAASAWAVLNRAKPKLLTGGLDLDSGTWKMALCTSAQSITADFAGTSTDARYSDLTGQVANGNGYTTGGQTITLTVTRSTGTVTVDTSDVSFTSSTFDAKYAVIYCDSATNKDILCFCDLETGDADGLSPNNGTLSVTIHASGLFTLA